ncbi:glycosyltransferase [Pseudozyma hubeiensis SY62]|uniref:chitin synthase n=1 Tax=Pseudozyma hubeiensis (strain SY62) TaxID=1305764 RepID=R9NZL9_PSEHS|nr:glycosyltransferase [Pseudozyma hubeiensis SY62]GAC94313.1 glycosyltransferase [Pseudozyma hubeiensis SY62]
MAGLRDTQGQHAAQQASEASTSKLPFQLSPVPSDSKRRTIASSSLAALANEQQEAETSTSQAHSSNLFRFAPVPERFRRYLNPPNVDPYTPFPTRDPISKLSSAISSRRTSRAFSVASSVEEDDLFDDGSFDTSRFTRGVSSYTFSSFPSQPPTPSTPMTPMTPMTPGFHRSNSSKLVDRRKSSVMVHPDIAEQSEQQSSHVGILQLQADLEASGPIPEDASASTSEQEWMEELVDPRQGSFATSSESSGSSRSNELDDCDVSSVQTDAIQAGTQPDLLAQLQPKTEQEQQRTRLDAPQSASNPAQVFEQDPSADSNEVPSTASEAASAPSLSMDEVQPVNETDKDRDVEKVAMHASDSKTAFDESLFPDYAPLVQSRVDAGRIGLMMAIGALNFGMVILFLFLAPIGASLVVMVALKSRDILSVLWQSLLFILATIARPFRKKKEKVIHPPRKIVSLVPVYKESTQDVLDTVDSIITDNPVRPQDFNIIAIMADGFDVEDDVIIQTTICRVEDHPYFSWKIRQSAFRLQFGFRSGHPIMIVRKVKNAGKKDSLIFAFDLFNSDNEATGHCNTEARALVLDHIRRLYDQPDLEYFDFVFCTDADTKILAGSVNVLADRLMDEGEQTVGACGIVEADFEKPGRSLRTCGLWYFWDHFQGFQYTYGQWIRRRSESSWGRVTCMPGAITMLRTGSILGQASAEYRKHVPNGNLVNRQVQYQGTDRRLCWSIISRSKNVRTVLETRAACFTIPPQSLSHYLSQRRRWGSNAYFNAFVTLTGPNQHLVTRIWMSLELTRSTLVFFRMYNFAHFVYNLVTKFTLLGVAPLLAITLLPQIWFMLFVVVPTKRYRPLVHHLLYGAICNRLCSIVLTPTVYANVLLGFGDFRWGKSHTGANAANQEKKEADDQADAMERGESRPCTPPKDQTEIC